MADDGLLVVEEGDAQRIAGAGPAEMFGPEFEIEAYLEMHAQILTYSRSRGVFAGVSLDGSVVEPDHRADQALYGTRVDRKDILNGKVSLPEPARELVAEIRRYTEAKKVAHKASRE